MIIHFFFPTLTSSYPLPTTQIRCMNMRKLYDVDPNICGTEMDVARCDYEFIMNRAYFDVNMRNKTNFNMYRALNIPQQAFPLPAPVPLCGTVEGDMPTGRFKLRLAYCNQASFLGYSVAVSALQGAIVENAAVRNCVLLGRYSYCSHPLSPFVSPIQVFSPLTISIDVVVADPLHDKTLTLDRYERAMVDQLINATRSVKVEWPARTGKSILRVVLLEKEADDALAAEAMRRLEEQARALGKVLDKTALQAPPVAPAATAPGGTNFARVKYDVSMRNVFEYTASSNPIKTFLERVTFMMSEVLTGLVRRTITDFTETMQALCACDVVVKGIRDIHVTMPKDSIYITKVLPPLFSVSFRVTLDDRMLNKRDVDRSHEEIKAWNTTKEAKQGDKCPIALVKPIMGKTFEYDFAPAQFKTAVLKVFDSVLSDFQEVPHVQKFVMEKVYFPFTKYIPSVTEEEPWVQEARSSIGVAMDKAVAPLEAYLQFFTQFEEFLNTDAEAYINKQITVLRRDPDSTEIELPVTVDLGKVASLLNQHLENIADIEASLPVTPVACGLFQIEVLSVRKLLLDRHRAIVKLILTAQRERCYEICNYMDAEFKKIFANLSKHPENVEQLVEMEEYITSLTNILQALNGCIGDMVNYHNLLDDFKFKVDGDHSNFKWSIISSPLKVALKCQAVQEVNVAIKLKFKDEMMGDQAIFIKTLKELNSTVEVLSAYTDVTDVENICAKVREVEGKLNVAVAKSRLFNSREGLFDVDSTDYEELSRIQRAFEPYSNLWQTALEWTEKSRAWNTGQFVDLDAEECERSVEKYFSAITKAAKFFNKMEMKEQMEIANQIKAQVTEFRPEVPMLVTLRNPGMRDRHWEKISETLGVTITPIEDFTTQQIIALNLKDSLELIQKISESAAKEYQIEQALDKMEREWEGVNLQISPYRETGTGVIKGVDDINVVLDEQITMTQTIMFSAFKGPFEERIDEWNRKLCCVSDVLEVWVTVQRNWLYLQPIFESPDINRQLPTEGKKFSTVDKNWRAAITNAKINPKVLDFCDNEKLLERFKESEILLDQVQKGLSDYLETKRSVFARFYFLSNDELLSILSESKDVKLVQPHLKKCFEGIDKVKFLDDLRIDRFISPEGEEIMMTEIINPVGKNVEHWMLELEGMMRISIRDVMGRAIADYTETPRPKWMQKWAGMCVLNGSQMHWTREMEELFLAEGVQGPVTMFERQKAQLADMTILVRGKLSNAARVTVGALTVIDVHARDVIFKLVDEAVETKDNFSWTSQLRYYWEEGELWAQMVAATRPYGYEYLGNSFRLVITPLTDKCYLTLMGALQVRDP